MKAATTKTNARLSWLTIAGLLLEVLPLVFITLVLVCPAPFQSNSLALIVVAPNTASLSTSTNGTGISNSNTTATATNATVSSVNGTNTSSSVQLPLSTATVTTTRNATLPGSNSTASTTAPTASASPAQNLPANSLPRREYPSAMQVMPTKQLELPLAASSTVLANTTASPAVAVTPTGASIRLRIGPLGSCFRDASGRETCTSSKLQSSYNFDTLSAANITTTDLPSGMTTFPLVMLILIVALLLKVPLDLGLVFLPVAAIPIFLSSTTSRTHTSANWLVCAIAIVLAISTGIERNKMSTAADAFNSSNQTRLMDSLPLMAQTGSSFGFVWISVALLAVNFFLRRYSIKKDIATAPMQFKSTTSTSTHSLPQYAPQTAPDFKADPSSTSHVINNVERSTHRASVLDLLRSLIPAAAGSKRTAASRGAASSPSQGSNDIAMSALVLDEYIRRHYRGDHEDNRDNSHLHNVPLAHHDMFAAYASDTKNRNRMQAKESPPFHAYQADLENKSGSHGAGHFARHQRGQLSEDMEEEGEARSKMASPAPSYWTDRGQDSQYRREKERIYMAELRRQRTMHSS